MYYLCSRNIFCQQTLLQQNDDLHEQQFAEYNNKYHKRYLQEKIYVTDYLQTQTTNNTTIKKKKILFCSGSYGGSMWEATKKKKIYF